MSEQIKYSLNDDKIRSLVKTITVSICSKFFINQSDIQDVVQGVYFALLRTQYLLRFDSEKGELKFYIYGFIKNFVSKYSKRERRRNKVFLSLDKNITNLNVSMGDMVVSKKLDKITSEDIKFVMGSLEKASPASSFIVYDENGFAIFNFCANAYKKKKGDYILKRSASIIFWLLYNGYSQTQITDFLKVSRSWVSKKVAMIRENEIFINWAKAIREPDRED